MMPRSKAGPQLRHVPVRLRVSVDPEAWQQIYGGEDVAEEVRRHVRQLVDDSAARHEGAIVSARRDGL